MKKQYSNLQELTRMMRKCIGQSINNSINQTSFPYICLYIYQYVFHFSLLFIIILIIISLVGMKDFQTMVLMIRDMGAEKKVYQIKTIYN